MDICRIVSLDEIRFVTHSFKVLLKFFSRNAGQKAGVRNFVPIQMQDRQHAPVTSRIKEFIAVPSRSKRSRLGLAVANNARNDQVRIIECSAISVTQCIPKLTSFVDTARCFRSHMTGDATGETELLEQPFHAVRVPADVGIDLAVGPFQIGVRDE